MVKRFFVLIVTHLFSVVCGICRVQVTKGRKCPLDPGNTAIVQIASGLL